MWPVGAPRHPRRHGGDDEARRSTTGRWWGDLGVVMDVRVSACVPRGRRRPWPTHSRCGAPWPTQRGPTVSRGRLGLTVGVVEDRMVAQWRGECSEEPVQCRAELLRCCSRSGRHSGLRRSRAAPARLPASLLLLLLRSFFLFLLSSARAGGWWCGSPPRRRGDWKRPRLRGVLLIGRRILGAMESWPTAWDGNLAIGGTQGAWARVLGVASRSWSSLSS